MAKLSDDPIERLEALKGVRLSDYKRIKKEYDVLSTGIFNVDYALGNLSKCGLFSGITGRDKIEICGKNNSLKSAFADEFALATLNRWPDLPVPVCGVFSEMPMPIRLENKGIDGTRIGDFSMINPDDEETQERMALGLPPKIDILKAEEALENLIKMAELEATKLCIIDSVAALVTGLQLLDGKDHRDLDSNPVAALAKVFNNFMIQFNKRNACSVLLLVNHWKPQIKTGFSFGPPDSHGTIETPGGKAIDFLCDVRILITANQEFDYKQKHSTEGTPKFLGHNVTWDIFKNKYGHVRKVTGYWDAATHSFNQAEKVIETASFFGNRKKEGKEQVTESPFDPPIATSGAYTYIGDKSLQGAAKVKEFLKENPAIIEKLKPQLYPTHKNYFDDNPKYVSTTEISKQLQNHKT